MRHGSDIRTGYLKMSMVMRLKIYIQANVDSVLKASPRSRFIWWTPVGPWPSPARAQPVGSNHASICNPIRSRSRVNERLGASRAGIREEITKASRCAKETSHQRVEPSTD